MRLQVALLPQSSVAVQVRVILYVPVHEPCVVTFEKVSVTLASQASETVGAINTGIAGQLIGVFCVAQVNVGGVLSRTMMVALHVPL